MGKKRRAENAPAEDETDDARRKRMRDQHLKDEVERYNVRHPLFLELCFRQFG